MLELQNKAGANVRLGATTSNWNLPNALSVIRMLLTPLAIVLLVRDTTSTNIAAALAMGACGLTDMLDGRIARGRGIVTRLGAFLDPLADKVYIGGALIALAAMGRISAWIPALILFREIGITLFRVYAESRHVSVPASMLGKLKTNVQLLAILVSILDYHIGSRLILPQTLMWLAVAITLVSGADYLLKSRKILAKSPSRGSA